MYFPYTINNKEELENHITENFADYEQLVHIKHLEEKVKEHKEQLNKEKEHEIEEERLQLEEEYKQKEEKQAKQLEEEFKQRFIQEMQLQIVKQKEIETFNNTDNVNKEEELKQKEEELNQKEKELYQKSKQQEEREMNEHETRVQLSLYEQKMKNLQEDNNKLQENLQEEVNKRNEIIELHDGINSRSSYYVGEYNEQIIQTNIKDKFIDWNIDEEKKMKCMDIRMYHNSKDISVGIECKNKNKITKSDLNKFTSDKSSNKFTGNIFISNTSIPNILNKENSCTIINNDLYIYSQCLHTIINYIEAYIVGLVEKDNDDNRDNINIEDIYTLYNNHNTQKRQLLKQDKVFLQLIKEESLLKNHLYLVTKTNSKGGKAPY